MLTIRVSSEQREQKVKMAERRKRESSRAAGWVKM
jgi:hypothetical protein